MFTKITDFLTLWRSEAEATQNYLDTLTDESLSRQEADDHRTLGRMAWHIVTTVPEMMARTGLVLATVDPEAAVPETAKEIAAAYRQVSKTLIEALETQWNDETLLEERNMYGETWVNGFTLTVLILHQVHHRGQMSVLMRQAGLKPPGIYGPTKEEWDHYGMPAPVI